MTHFIHMKTCPLCDGRKRTEAAEEKNLTVFHCRGCGLFYVSPRVVHDDKFQLKKNFSEDKYEDILLGRAPHPRDRNYNHTLAEIERIKPTGRLLDIGSHMGFFLRVARRRGWDVQGVEPNAEKIEYARKYSDLPIEQGFLDTVDLPKHAYDVATMTDVLEHVFEPEKLLGQVRSHLKPDGLLVVKVPNGTYNFWKWKLLKLAGSSRKCWDAEEHIFHYTEPTLRMMLNKSGFIPIRTVAPKPIRSRRISPYSCCGLRNPAYVFRETGKDALFTASTLFSAATGSFFALNPDILCIAQPRR